MNSQGRKPLGGMLCLPQSTGRAASTRVAFGSQRVNLALSGLWDTWCIVSRGLRPWLLTFALTGLGLIRFWSPAHAQSVKSDTIRRITAPPVQVTAERRDADELVISPLDVRHESRATLLERANVTTLAEALERSTPSLNIRSYGPLGGIALASFRGLPAEYTIVYRDGIRITNEQNSLTDLARIGVGGVESIDLIPGSASILLGGDAIGTALNIVSKRAAQTSYSLASNICAYEPLTSMPQQEYRLELAQKVADNFGITASALTTFTRGDFPFYQPTTGVTVHRENADAHLADGNLGAELKLGNGGVLTGSGTFSRAERGAPWVATTDYRGASLLYARQYDEDLLLWTKYTQPVGESWRFTLDAFYQSQYETYIDPQDFVDDHYLNRIFGAALRTEWIPDTSLTISIGLSSDRSLLYSNQNAISNSDTVVPRERTSLFVAARYQPISWLVTSIGIRTELVSDLDTVQTVPQFALDLRPLAENLSIHAAYSRSYHVPTFNQLYWRNLGVKQLIAEHGDNLEFGIGSKPTFLPGLSLRVSVFQSNIENLIIWQPGAGNLFHPSNISSARSRGLEVEINYTVRIDEQWRVDANAAYTWMNAENRSANPAYFEKEIPYSTPTASIETVTLAKESLGVLAFTARYKGHRYSDIANAKSGKLEPYTLFDAKFTTREFEIQKHLAIQASIGIQDILNTQYSEVLDYPMPARQITIGIQLTSQHYNEE